MSSITAIAKKPFDSSSPHRSVMVKTTAAIKATFSTMLYHLRFRRMESTRFGISETMKTAAAMAMTVKFGQMTIATAQARNSPEKMKSSFLRSGIWVLYRRAIARIKVARESRTNSTSIRDASSSSGFFAPSKPCAAASPMGIISREKNISTMVAKLMLLFFFFFFAVVFIGLPSLY